MSSHIAQDEWSSRSENPPSRLFGFCLAVPVIPIASLVREGEATATNYSEWTSPDGGSPQSKERDWYKDTD
jgi:hypothetical protein